MACSPRVSHLTRILNIEYRDNLHSRQLGLVIMKVGQLTLPFIKNFRGFFICRYSESTVPVRIFYNIGIDTAHSRRLLSMDAVWGSCYLGEIGLLRFEKHANPDEHVECLY